ncbi:MAG TPA: hypothetical protein DF984_00600 [Anaerolineaceae bacterium]|nr:hypothetical protein [Anaerolineaceae bacterium]
MANRQSDEKSRAEQVRARRQQNRKKQPQVSTVGTSATRKQPTRTVPVTRRTSTSVPMIKRQGRKVDVPLKTKGAMLQIPALPRLHIGWRLISGAIFSLSLAVVITFSSLGTFKVSAINLEGAERLTPETLTAQLGLTGTAIIKVQPDDLETRIVALFPELSSVKVSVGLPASVTIKVVERQPLIAWYQDGTTYWIDAEGVLFPASGETPVSQTVYATGNPPAAYVPLAEDTGEEATVKETAETESLPGTALQKATTTEFVQGVMTLLNYLPENSALQFDPEYGLGWQDPQGWLVYFGKDIENIDLKLIEYQMIIAKLSEENLTPALISLEFLHAPFYRLER